MLLLKGIFITLTNYLSIIIILKERKIWFEKRGAIFCETRKTKRQTNFSLFPWQYRRNREKYVAINYDQDIVILDAGLMFRKKMLGVDIVIPDITYLIKIKIRLNYIPFAWS